MSVQNELEQAAVYRLYDAEGALLYVGVSRRPAIRWSEHAASKKWWPEVCRRDAQWHPDMATARQAEAVAIREEAPRYNIAIPQADGSLRGWVKRSDAPPTAYGSLQAAPRNVRIPDDLWERLREAVKRTDPDASPSALVRLLARWYVWDIDELPRRPEPRQSET